MMDEYFARCTQLKKTTNYIESPTLSRKMKLKPSATSTSPGNGEAVIREINQIHNSNYDKEIRAELLGGNGATDDASTMLRRRIGGGTGVNGGTNGTEEMAQANKYYEDMQEKIAENMLSMTRSLKEQTETANKIIRRDTEVGTGNALVAARIKCL